MIPCKEADLARRWMQAIRTGREIRTASPVDHVRPDALHRACELPLSKRLLTDRQAWEHPQDVVMLFWELPGLEEPLRAWGVRVAWLHDIIEDGVKEDGSPVTEDDLRHELDDGVLDAVVELSHHKLTTLSEDRHSYLSRVTVDSGLDVLLVKLCDRVCNMREAALSFKAARWARYVDECSTYFLPGLERVRKVYPQAYDFLRTELCRAMGARPVVRPEPYALLP